MPAALLLCVSLLAELGASISRKSYTDRNTAGRLGVFLFNFAVHLTVAFVLLLWGGFDPPSRFTVLLALVFGLVTFLQGISLLGALGCGPMSYTTLIVSFSTLISALSGTLLFHEQITLAQGVGIILMLVSFVLAAKKDGTGARKRGVWLLLCLLTFLLTGGIGVLQKIHQSSPFREEANEFLVLAFLLSAALSLLLSLCLFAKAEKKPKGSTASLPLPRLLLLLLLCGTGAAVNNKLNLSLSGVIDSAVFFPTVNGGSLMLSMLAAFLLFKERPSTRQWLGISVGVLAVLLLCIPI